MSAGLLQALADGEAALEAGDWAGAEVAFGRASDIAPLDVGIALALANVYRLRDSLGSRRAVLEQAFRTGDWTDVHVAHALGAALLECGAALEAAECFLFVTSRRPSDPAALSALAAAKRAGGDPTAAWPLVKRALELAPRQASIALTAAQVRHDLGDLLGALKWLEKAEQWRPGHAPTRLQRAYTTLLKGPSREGWRLFEHRPLPVPAGAALAWTGEPLDGRSVLVLAEQGIGDFLQFLRFVPGIVERGAGRVVIECHAALLSLLRGNGYDVVERGTAVETDVYVPLLSLPHVLEVGGHVAGDAVPYLHASGGEPPALPPRDGRPRIGLVWAGNPHFTQAITRDLPPAMLPELVAAAEVQWIVLQQGEAGALTLPGVAPRVALTDWAMTASVLTHIDGLVSTDTGIVHLAGAMGVPAWVLLQKVPDWRWGVGGSNTPWYPGHTLARQIRPGDWRGPVNSILTKLLR